MKIEEIKTKYNKLNDEYQAFKKDQENSPVSIVRVKDLFIFFMKKTFFIIKFYICPFNF